MEEEYKRLIEEIKDAYFLIQQEKIVLVSNHMSQYCGYSKDELIGRSFLELIAPEERERLSELYRRRLAGHQVQERYESLFLTKDGASVPVEVSVWLTHYHGQPAVAGIARDITEHKHFMEELRDSEERYRSIIENSPDIIYTADTEGIILSVNKASKTIIGFDPEELIGRKFMDFIPKEAMSQVLEDHNQLCSGNKVASETLVIRKDGIERHLEFISAPFVKDGIVTKAQGVIRDITDRKRIEEKLRLIFESVADGVTVTDLDGVITELNEKTAELHGYASKDGLLGKSAFELIAQCDRERAMENMYRTMELGLIRDIEYRLLRMDGSEFWGELSASVLKDAYGKPTGFIAITRDITERKKAEEALRESAEKLRLMFECAPYGVIMMDSNAIITQVNDQALKLHGVFSKGELIGKDGSEYVNPCHRKSMMQNFHRCLNDGLVIGVEYTIFKADGFEVSVETSAGVIRDIAGNPIGLIAITRDITDERQLRDNKQFYINEIITSQENEKRSLARALHDDTIQELLLATHRLQDAIAGTYGRLPKRAQGYLGEVRELIDRIITGVRGFTADLRPDILDDIGLVPALKWLTNRLNNGDGVVARLNIVGEERRLPPETELTLFRIAQEALSNVRRHASATIATVALKFDERKVAMSISDNGRGFELPCIISEFTRQHKLGLTGIAERVHLLDGRYKFESSPGKGTVVRIEIDG